MDILKSPRVHFLGICGKAMGGIATALAREGWLVTGSDEECYAPMNEFLEAGGIPICMPYHAKNVPPDTNVVVVGKRIAQDNPELVQVLRQGIPHLSFPQFLSRYFLGSSRNAVVAGGVGKTTTTAMLAWILECSGLGPDYLIGGMAKNFSAPARFRNSAYAVLEGDEYASCFDDARPKFLHYDPELVVITNVLEDHPDLYGSREALCEAFGQLIGLIPATGCLVVPDHDETAVALAQRARCRVIMVGFGPASNTSITHVNMMPEASAFRLHEVDFAIPLCGRMNVRNAAMAAMAATCWGVQLEQAADALALFSGVGNRQEEQHFGGCTLVCDKASHPHALGEFAGALRQRFAGRRLVSVIQPRATGGRRWIYQKHLPDALARFDKVLLTGPYEHAPHQPNRWAQDPFCLDLLAEDLRQRGMEVVVARALSDVGTALGEITEEGDVVALTAMEQSHALREAVELGLRRKGVEAVAACA